MKNFIYKYRYFIIAGLIILIIAIVVIIYINRIKIKKGLRTMTSFAKNLKDTTISEYEAWKNGSIKEGDSSTMDRLRKYWREGAGVTNWSDTKMTDEAWSAAFISYVMKKSGAGSDWKYSTSHSTYIVDSIKNRKENNSNPFKGYKPEEVKLEVGDLVGKARQSGVDYDTKGNYKSHTDIVVNIKDGIADTIGGNVSDSVYLTKVPIDASGKIDNSKVAGNKYFVVIKNKK
jgi:hypothetical protein